MQVTIWYRAPELLLGAKHYTRCCSAYLPGKLYSAPQALLSRSVRPDHAHAERLSCTNMLLQTKRPCRRCITPEFG